MTVKLRVTERVSLVCVGDAACAFGRVIPNQRSGKITAAGRRKITAAGRRGMPTVPNKPVAAVVPRDQRLYLPWHFKRSGMRKRIFAESNSLGPEAAAFWRPTGQLAEDRAKRGRDDPSQHARNYSYCQIGTAGTRQHFSQLLLKSLHRPRPYFSNDRCCAK